MSECPRCAELERALSDGKRDELDARVALQARINALEEELAHQRNVADRAGEYAVALQEAATYARTVLGDWVQGVEPASPQVSKAWHLLDQALTKSSHEICPHEDSHDGAPCAHCGRSKRGHAVGHEWDPDNRPPMCEACGGTGRRFPSQVSRYEAGDGYLCKNCGKHWGLHPVSDQRCPAQGPKSDGPEA